MAGAKLVLTDSGGVQEESTVLAVPGLTPGSSAERPVTVDYGTNLICGSDPDRFVAAAQKIIGKREYSSKTRPDLRDGRAGEGIADTLEQYFADLLPNSELDNFVLGAPV